MGRRLRLCGTVLLAMSLAVGCGDDGDGVTDAGALDAGSQDSGQEDAGANDGGDDASVDGGEGDSSADDAGADGGPPTSSCTGAIPALRSESVVTSGRFSSPLYVTQPPGSTDLYVVERGGRIRIVRGGEILATPFLDVSSRLAGTPSGGAEWGLLGLAFHPDYETNGRFFVTYTPNNGDNILAEGTRSENPDVAASTVTPILTIEDFASNHNGGMITFGADGFLYYGTGDGGGSGDPRRTAQNLGSLLGKLLRLDVSVAGTATGAAGNPFVELDGARPEIYAYGLRNPWRFSFDRESGDMWIGDVGQNRVEEIDYATPEQLRGANFGWSDFEGTRDFAGDTLRGPSPHHPPIYEYGRSEGFSTVGGYVYRGEAIPALQGAYLFGDSGDGFVRALRVCDGEVTREAEDVTGLSGDRPVYGLVSFGQDNAGELYLVFLSTGEVHRVLLDD